MTLPPDERALRARLVAHVSWSKTEDRIARTQPAKDKFDERFEKEVDPEGKLEPAERRKRAESARKAYFTRLALKSVQARRKKDS